MSLAAPVLRNIDEEIPVLDLAPYLAGTPGALERLAGELRHAFEHIGFYFIKGHGVPQALCDQVFAEAARFHARSLDEKMKVKRNQHNVGYLPMKGATTRHSRINPDNKPNLNEAFFVKRDLSLNHPDVIANKRFRCANLWPEDMPGFRETVVAYCDALEALALGLIPIYARALDLPAGHFAQAFSVPQYTLRMSHYPTVEVVEDNEFGIAPHTDTSFMTLLAQNKIPGLSLRTSTGKWTDAPALDGHFLVNGGDMLRRWTNERFLATPHRVINRSGRDRYAIPFFFDCQVDWPIECLPTCVSAERPAKFEPFTYGSYMAWYQDQNYARDSADGVKIQAY